ncbi:hypothetical protein J6590_104276 [Homalodisca vitripennis]|nr:hypothetical protein J6590_104276 [Homalodisca vitripennis]
MMEISRTQDRFTTPREIREKQRVLSAASNKRNKIHLGKGKTNSGTAGWCGGSQSTDATRLQEFMIRLQQGPANSRDRLRQHMQRFGKQ